MKKQPAVLYMVISILVLVIVALTFAIVQQNSIQQTENSGTDLPTTQQSTDSSTPSGSFDSPDGNLENEEILTPPEVQDEEVTEPILTYEGETRVLSGIVKSKTQTQIVIAEDVVGEDFIIETADTSSVNVDNYLTAECTNIQENVCQASSISARSTEEIN